jgi:hypothetical protein
MRVAGSVCGWAAALAAVSLVLLSCGGRPSPIQPLDPIPTAQAEPPAKGSVCFLGDGAPNAICKRGGPSRLLPHVQAAVDRTVAKHPQAFKLDHVVGRGTRQYEVVDRAAYLHGVVDELRAAGLCAELNYANQNLVDVKDENGFSERFLLYQTPDGHGYILQDSYQKTCTPASFPVVPDADGPPMGSGCNKPYPPPIGSFNSRPYMTQGSVWTMDSTPIITYDKEYCASVGYTDGRIHCALRTEGDDERRACENWRVGTAADTGLPGPTWTRDGEFCTGRESGCAHHPENPYQLLVYENGSGHYRVCAQNGVCADVDVHR